MHFVFINQYYPPDAAPTGIMLVRVVQEIVKAGHEVTVISARGGYALQYTGGREGGNEGDSIEEVQQDGVRA